MKYQPGEVFAYEALDANIIFSTHPFAKLVASLLEIKAMQEYYNRQGITTRLAETPEF